MQRGDISYIEGVNPDGELTASFAALRM